MDIFKTCDVKKISNKKYFDVKTNINICIEILESLLEYEEKEIETDDCVMDLIFISMDITVCRNKDKYYDEINKIVELSFIALGIKNLDVLRCVMGIIIALINECKNVNVDLISENILMFIEEERSDDEKILFISFLNDIIKKIDFSNEFFELLEEWLSENCNNSNLESYILNLVPSICKKYSCMLFLDRTLEKLILMKEPYINFIKIFCQLIIREKIDILQYKYYVDAIYIYLKSHIKIRNVRVECFKFFCNLYNEEMGVSDDEYFIILSKKIIELMKDIDLTSYEFYYVFILIKSTWNNFEPEELILVYNFILKVIVLDWEITNSIAFSFIDTLFTKKIIDRNQILEDLVELGVDGQDLKDFIEILNTKNDTLKECS